MNLEDRGTHVETSAAPRLRALPLAGPAASLAFTSSLVGFAAARSDGYSHARKAVSELGALGAPAASAFNLLGFVVPGALVIGLAVAILQRAPRRTCRTGVVLLGLSGLSMALAGVFPVDMGARASLTSTLHLIAASASGLLWCSALFWLGPVLRRHLGLHTLGRLTPWFGLFLVANVAWQAVWQSTGLVYPGWGQRIGFAGYFLWTFSVGVSLFARPTDRNVLSARTPSP